MAEIRCSPGDGWAGIAEALAKAKPDDQVLVAPGDYISEGTLIIPDRVSLIGRKVQLSHDGTGPAIMARNVTEAVVSGFHVLTGSREMERRALPDDPPWDPETSESHRPPPSEWGLVWFDQVDAGEIADIAITGTRTCNFQWGICVRGGWRNVVRDCIIRRSNGGGIALISSDRVVVADNEMTHCQGNGITAFRSLTIDQEHDISLINNRCRHNSGCGILLMSVNVQGLSESDCRFNDGSGIVLRRASHTPEIPSSGPIYNNACQDNGEGGIAILSSTSDGVVGNTCNDNASAGIWLHPDEESPEQPSSAVLQDNTCNNNGSVGILLGSASSSGITGNTCSGNQRAGIMLQRDSWLPERPSTAPIRHNYCIANRDNGILLSGCSSTGISSNTCRANAAAGIMLRPAPNDPDAGSDAPIQWNYCEDNEGSGIVIRSGESSEVADNRCTGNAASGIALVTSRAPLRNNFCRDNGGAGLLLLSSDSKSIFGNDCVANGGDGIALETDEDHPGRSSTGPLYKNICRFNKGDGIVLMSGTHKALENICTDNDGNGISVSHKKREDGATDDFRQTEVTGNQFVANGGAGMLLTNTSALVTENHTDGNGGGGLQHDAADLGLFDNDFRDGAGEIADALGRDKEMEPDDPDPEYPDAAPAGPGPGGKGSAWSRLFNRKGDQ